MNSGNLAAYKKIANGMFESMVQSIGIHVMLLVLEHALWKTKQTYQEASLINFTEEGITLDGFDQTEPQKAQLVANEFMMAIIATLGRLVGKQLAHHLAEQLLVEDKEE